MCAQWRLVRLQIPEMRAHFVRMPERKRELERPRCRWEGVIEVVFEGADLGRF
jgi:hypothetical protein